ncbi:unnamed protein product [Spirodela intermedia]|uniref:Uncharacterized protein n=1 Tax=Spirodela intermedia TaxID=51605 RepID=A0A7I8KL17_SPIIN|nr:unnamed protein product [Spirodela intermedia]
MESSLLHLLLLSSLLLAIVSAVAAQGAVLDSDGDALLRGRQYYARSIYRGGRGGGLTLVAANESCPSHVAQASPVNPNGLALAFFPENFTAGTISTGRTLYIRFAAAPPCSGGRSALWQVRQSSRYLTTGGSESSAVGPHNSRFAIYRDNSARGYQIQLCPCSAGVARPSCRLGCFGALGVTSARLLSLNAGSRHIVTFVKAK